MQPNITPLSGAIRQCAPALAAAFVLSLFINPTLLVSPIYSMQVYDRVLSSRNVGTLLFLTLIVGAFLTLYGLLEYARSGILVRAGASSRHRCGRPFSNADACPAGGRPLRAAADPGGRIHPRRRVDGYRATLCDCRGRRCSCSCASFCIRCSAWLPCWRPCSLPRWRSPPSTRRNRASSKRTGWPAMPVAIATSALRNCDVVRGLGMGDVTLERWSRAQSAAVALQALASERGAALLAMSKFARLAVQTMLLCAGAWLAIESRFRRGRSWQPSSSWDARWPRSSRRLANGGGSSACGPPTVACRSCCRSFRRRPWRRSCRPRSAGSQVENIDVLPPPARALPFQSVSLTLEPGEILAVIGASASGKSSLARALCGVWPLAHGTIRIDGAAYKQWDAEPSASTSAICPRTSSCSPARSARTSHVLARRRRRRSGRQGAGATR